MSGFIVTLTLFDKSEGYNEPRHYGQALIGVNASLLKSGVVSGLDHNVGVFLGAAILFLCLTRDS